MTPEDACLFFAAYCVWLALGHTVLSVTIKSGTINNYLADAAKLVQRGRKLHEGKPYPDPRIDVSTGKTHHAITQIKDEVKRWENMPNRREPLTKGMLTRLSLLVTTSLFFSLLYVLLDWFVLGIHTGFRLSEYAQKKSGTSLDRVQRNRDGRPKALIAEDFTFFGRNRRHLSHDEAIASPDSVESVDIRWREQKNGQNGERKTVVRNTKTPFLCAARASIRIIERARLLELHAEHPVCVFTNDGTATGAIQFVTESHIATCLQDLARAEYNITDPKELAKFTSHSIRVGACVALHAAGLDKLDIQHALRWRSQSFWNYLRNLPRQASRCMEAIRDFDPMKLSIPI